MKSLSLGPTEHNERLGQTMAFRVQISTMMTYTSKWLSEMYILKTQVLYSSSRQNNYVQI